MKRYYLIYVLLTLALTAPLWQPGYIFAIDMAFVPHLSLPAQVDNTFPFFVVLHILNFFIPADMLQKLIFFSIFLLASVGAHRLMAFLRPMHVSQRAWLAGCYFAGLLYVINPFVYSRMMTGQYQVLLGYILLPFFIYAWIACLRGAQWRKALVAGLWLTAIGIVSIHVFGMALLVLVLLGIVHWWSRRDDKVWGKQMGVATCFTLGVALLASSYWLAAALLGHGNTAGTVANFGKADLAAFATSPSGFGWLGNVLALQGFWADSKNLYLVPIDIFNWWWLPWLAVWALVIFGIYKSWQAQKTITAAFVALIIVAALLAIGTIGTWAAPVNQFLVDHVPFFAGYREPQKFVALIALAYAYFGGVAVAAMAEKIRLATVPLFALPLLLAPLLPGFYGQLTPHQYPADWFATDTYLQQTNSTAKVLFLPWHMYMPFGFAGRTIANPAQKFFRNPVVISNDPEMAGATGGPNTPDQQEIQTNIIPTLKQSTKSIAPALRMLNIRYVILAKELDYKMYANMDMEDGIKLVRETETLKLYEVIPN